MIGGTGLGLVEHEITFFLSEVKVERERPFGLGADRGGRCTPSKLQYEARFVLSRDYASHRAGNSGRRKH